MPAQFIRLYVCEGDLHKAFDDYYTSKYYSKKAFLKSNRKKHEENLPLKYELVQKLIIRDYPFLKDKDVMHYKHSINTNTKTCTFYTIRVQYCDVFGENNV